LSVDVAVVGASSAGLFVAEMLANNGKQVVLLERSPEIIPEERTYIITPGLRRVIPDIPERVIRHQISRIQLQAGTAEAEIQLSSPDLVIDRKELIQELAKRAEIAGVDIRFGYDFIGFQTQNGKTRMRFSVDEDEVVFEANHLIGADGVSSPVRAELKADPLLSVPLLQAVVDLPKDWEEGVSKVWFEPQDTPYFYWLIPDMDRKSVVGLIADNGADVQALLRSFLEREGFQPRGYQVGRAALHQKGSQISFQLGDLPVDLVGDAAGQVKVTTIGGTVTGLAAARALAESILGGRSFTYRQSSVKRELDLHFFIRQLLNRMTLEDYCDLLSSITPPVSSFLAKRDRDAMKFHFWKLTFLQPGFIPLGLRLLLRQRIYNKLFSGN
jgi:flavin-dependent dehydrogenase